jgi:predicted nucleic acid-binding protein
LIATDTSSIIAYLAGHEGADIVQIERAMTSDQLRIPPPVVSELLTQGSPELDYLLASIPQLEIQAGYWERAGRSRALLRSKGLKANLADTLIAQACIDGGAALVSRDRGYRHFAQWCGLTLAG